MRTSTRAQAPENKRKRTGNREEGNVYTGMATRHADRSLTGQGFIPQALDFASASRRHLPPSIQHPEHNIKHQATRILGTATWREDAGRTGSGFLPQALDLASFRRRRLPLSNQHPEHSTKHQATSSLGTATRRERRSNGLGVPTPGPRLGVLSPASLAAQNMHPAHSTKHQAAGTEHPSFNIKNTSL